MDGPVWLAAVVVVAAMGAGFGVYLARAKGRSEGEGFLFGLLLGPLGLLLIVLLPTVDEPETVEGEAEEEEESEEEEADDDSRGPRRYARPR